MAMSILMRFAEHEDGFQRDFCIAGHVRNLEGRHVEHAREIFTIFGHNEPSFFGARNRREAYLLPRKTTKQTKDCPVCGPPVAWRGRFCRIGETSRRIPRTPENDRSETSSLFSFSFYGRFRVVFPFRVVSVSFFSFSCLFSFRPSPFRVVSPVPPFCLSFCFFFVAGPLAWHASAGTVCCNARYRKLKKNIFCANWPNICCAKKISGRKLPKIFFATWPNIFWR